MCLHGPSLEAGLAKDRREVQPDPAEADRGARRRRAHLGEIAADAHQRSGDDGRFLTAGAKAVAALNKACSRQMLLLRVQRGAHVETPRRRGRLAEAGVGLGDPRRDRPAAVKAPSGASWRVVGPRRAFVVETAVSVPPPRWPLYTERGLGWTGRTAMAAARPTTERRVDAGKVTARAKGDEGAKAPR